MILSSIPYMPEAIQNWDVSVLNWIHEVFYENAFCRFFFPLITALGDKGIFCIAVAVVLLVIGIIGMNSKKVPLEKKSKYKKIMKLAITMGAALLLGLALGNGLLKNIFLRVRPYDLDGALVLRETALAHVPHDSSFPSGHTLAVFESSVVMCYYDKRFGIPSVIVAVLVALSRLFLYFHFPTDVIGGAIFGTINAILGILIVNFVFKLIEKKKTKKLQ